MGQFIQTDLRPDYYEYFPQFTGFELQSRRAVLSEAQASLLCAYNGADNEQSSSGTADGDLGRVLGSVGIEPRIAHAVGTTFEFFNRHCEWFMPGGLRNSSYQVPASSSTWVSAPGVVALMLTDLLPQLGSRILEIGAGVGVHAGALMMLRPDITFTGVEPCAEAIAHAKMQIPNLHPARGRDKTSFLNQKVQELAAGDWDVIYSTCAMPWNAIREIPNLSSYRPLVLQTPRPLLEAEFESERPESWLRRTFATYGNYLGGSNFRQYLAISTYRIDACNRFEELSTLYDVTFVPFEE